MKSVQVTKIQKSVVWLVILLLTIVSRFLAITNKPIHFDESINGWFVMQMKTLGFYKYDPVNYHGPLYFYLLQSFEFLWGRSLQTLRSVPSVFGVFSVMLFAFPVLRSKKFSYAVLLFLFLSPAFLFYGRSGIHEMPFVFFQLLFALGIFRWLENKDASALGLVATGLIGMMALKETFAITIVSWLVGLAFLGLPDFKKFFSWGDIKKAWTGRLTYLVVMLLVVFLLLFSGFGRNPAGLLDFVKAFLPWMKTGVGETGHNKEFLYWTKVLLEAEPLVLVGMALAFVGLVSKEGRLRMISAFSLFQFLVYSLIPYKTVWCILTLVWGFYFVLAIYVEKLWSNKNWKFWGLMVVILLGGIADVRSAWLAVYREPIDLEHPYVYVNSTYDLKEFQAMIDQTVKAHPELLQEPIQIGMKEQWPFPWTMRMFEKPRYDLCHKSVAADAWLYMCDPANETGVEKHLNGSYMRIYIKFRQSRETSLVYVRKNLFDQIYHGQYDVVGSEEEKK